MRRYIAAQPFEYFLYVALGEKSLDTAALTDVKKSLTGRLLQLHHQRLQSVESLQLLLVVTQVFLQDLRSLLDLSGVHLVRVLICRKQNVINGTGMA